MKRFSIGFISVVVLLGTTSAWSQPHSLSGRVLRVIGPDTLIIEGPGGVQYPIKPGGIQADLSNHAASTQAHDRLEESMVGRHVTVTNLVPGPGGGYSGVVNYGHQDMNEKWLEEGLFSYDSDSAPQDAETRYMTAEELARAAEQGVWRPMEFEGEPVKAGDIRPPEPGYGYMEATPPPGGWQYRPLN